MNENHEPLSDSLVSIQSWLSPALTPVLHNRDHQRLVDDLEKLDQDLKTSGLEAKAMAFVLEDLEEAASHWQRNRRAEFAVYALRVEWLRQMLGAIGKHARKHRDLLQQHYQQTQLSQAQSARIIVRIDEKLEQLPTVIEQAHERIIGERKVQNEDKILSADETEIDVIVRGKAGAQTEFGNELLLGESAGGLIVDYMLYGKGAPSEGEVLLFTFSVITSVSFHGITAILVLPMSLC